MSKLKWHNRIIFSIISIVALIISVPYVLNVTEYCEASFDGNKPEDGKLLNYIILLESISLATLTVALTVMSLMLMHRLRNRFHGLYTDYSRSLWIVVITQIVSLCIGATLWVLEFYCKGWKDFWNKNLHRLVIN